jgi:hypothetical protein
VRSKFREIALKLVGAALCGGLLVWLDESNSAQHGVPHSFNVALLAGGMGGAALFGGRVGPIGWWAVAGGVFGAIAGYLLAPEVEGLKGRASAWHQPLVSQVALAGFGVGSDLASSCCSESETVFPAGSRDHETAGCPMRGCDALSKC